MDGGRSWYPNGGDTGYTDIKLTSGADFENLSFRFVSYGGGNLQYSLLNNGMEVLGGSLASGAFVASRAGFSGGGFDELLIRGGNTGVFGDNRLQGLQIDSIKAGAATVPEPASLALLGFGLIGVAVARRKSVK